LGSGWRSYAPEKMLHYRHFWPAPKLELPAQAWTSRPHSSWNFWQT
jgi:hypothetical protein